jgi:hypothetical protein
VFLPGDPLATVARAPRATTAGATRAAKADRIRRGKEETIVDGSHPDFHATIRYILSFYA